MKQMKTLFAGIALSIMMIGCGGSSSSDTPQTGTLALKLIDAPGNFSAVYVTIKEVKIHMSASDENNETNETQGSVAVDQNVSEAEWKTVISPNTTYDLLTLQNGVEALLGEGNLTVGHYTQMRLVLTDEPDESNNTLGEAHPFGNYVIVDGGASEIIIPSALQSGIKLIKGFDIDANTTTTLTLDFDANKSVYSTGNGQWKLKPTIKIIQE